MAKPRILVIDDEPHIQDMVTDALSLMGYAVTSESNGFDALKVLRAEKFSLVITDVNMPKLGGFELVEYLRSHGDSTPVIFLTARNQKPDIAEGFRSGADDYITKPFGLEELTLRVAAILRRTSPPEESNLLLSCGPIVVDEKTHITTVDGNLVDLSPTEFRLLVYLIENKNNVLTKHALLERIWGIDFSDSTTVVDTFISYLRRKIHTPGFNGIQTVRGIGFRIVEH